MITRYPFKASFKLDYWDTARGSRYDAYVERWGPMGINRSNELQSMIWSIVKRMGQEADQVRRPK